MLISTCPLCGGAERHYSFVTGDERFDQCTDCGMLSHAVKARESADVLEYRGANSESGDPQMIPALFPTLDSYVGDGDRTLLVVGKASAIFLEEARRRGFQPIVLNEGERPTAPCSVVAVLYVLEDMPNPVTYVSSVREQLANGGVLAVVTRQLAKTGWQVESGRILERRQRHSFSDANLETLLWKAGFGDVYLDHAQGGSTDRAIAFARMREKRSVPRLSVVVPVFNEASTLRHVLAALETKQIPGVDIEVVLVESASTDGSREIVLEYRDRPRFRVVLEERPRGKGHAVRTGFQHATGDVILIQDADLEYDFLDYEMLISPVLRGKAAFVLGTRHAGNWKIRKFAKHYLANVLNLGHWALVGMMNRFYGQSMTDPFTMFKVFRADCLSGLDFECNRFDFDLELVCKLIRKGYTPLEIPVNYQARSFEEGKKVRMFRDPPTWIRAMLKYRSARVHHLPAPPRREAAATPEQARVVAP
jgi:hypothetical protein